MWYNAIMFVVSYIKYYKQAPITQSANQSVSQPSINYSMIQSINQSINPCCVGQELVKLVVTHKAQLIRKDQYIRELEGYIDNLLVRVMETSPRILQNL